MKRICLGLIIAGVLYPMLCLAFSFRMRGPRPYHWRGVGVAEAVVGDTNLLFHAEHTFSNQCAGGFYSNTSINSADYGTQSVGGSIGTFLTNGIDMDGSDDYYELTNSILLNGATALTFSCRVFIEVFSDFDGFISSRGSGSDHLFLIEVDAASRSCRFDVGDGTSSLTIQAGHQVLDSNIWYLITGTWDGTTNGAKIYIDGVDSSVTLTPRTFTGPASQTDVFKIGWEDSNAARKLNGVIDDVRIYSRCLTSQEVAQLEADWRP